MKLLESELIFLKNITSQNYQNMKTKDSLAENNFFILLLIMKQKQMSCKSVKSKYPEM